MRITVKDRPPKSEEKDVADVKEELALPAESFDMIDEKTLAISHAEWYNLFGYKDAGVQLADLTIISGDRNGSGKTTLPQAICYGLTGKFFNDITEEDALRKGTAEMRVNLYGKNGSDDFRLMRQKKRDTTAKVEIVVGKEKRTYKGVNAKNELSDIITYEDFLHSIYINGHDIEILMHGSAASQAKQLDKMFGIDDITLIVTKLRSALHQIEKRKFESERCLFDRKSRLDEIEKDVGGVVKREDVVMLINENKSKLISLSDEIQHLQVTIAPYHDTREQRLKYERDLSDLKNKKHNYETQKDDALQEYKKLQHKVDAIRADIEKFVNKSNADDTLKELTNRITIIERKIDEITAKNTLIHHASAILSHMIKEKDLSCYICESKYSIDEIHKFETRKSIISHDSESEITTAQLLEKRKAILKTQYNTVLQIQAREKVFLDRMHDIQKRVASFSTAALTIDTTINSLITPDAIDDEKYQSIRMQIAEKQAQSKYIENSMIEWTNQIEKFDRATTRSDLILKIRSEIDSITKQIDLYARDLAKIGTFETGFRNILVHLRTKMIDEINPSIMDWIRLLTQSGKKTTPPLQYWIELKEEHGEKTERIEYVNNIKYYGEHIVYDTLSTGQRAICAISLIMALSDIAQHHLSLIVFDELHTSGIDTIALQKMLQIAVKIAKKKARVIFIDRRQDLIDTLYTIADEEKVSFMHYQARVADGISVMDRIYPK